MEDDVNSYRSKAFDEHILARATAANVKWSRNKHRVRRARVARHKLAIPMGRSDTICGEASRLEGRTALVTRSIVRQGTSGLEHSM
jgi:hypothetical protein